MAGFHTTEISGAFSIDAINGRVNETEESRGPFLSMAVRADGTNFATFQKAGLDEQPPSGDQLTKLVIADNPTTPGGRVAVFFGTVNVAGTPTKVLAHRKA